MEEQTQNTWGTSAYGGLLHARVARELLEHAKPSIFTHLYGPPSKALTRRDRLGMWASDWKGRFVLAWRALRGEDLE